MNGVPVRRRTSHGFSRSSLRRPTSHSLPTIPDTTSPGRSGALRRRPVTSGSGAPEAAQEAPRCSCWADTLLWPRQLNELTVAQAGKTPALTDEDIRDPWGNYYQYNQGQLNNKGIPIIATQSPGGVSISNQVE